MMNKLAIAMIVASMSALPMASAYAQTSSGSNNAQPATGQNSNSTSGQKPTDQNGMPTNCKEGDTACSTDPGNATNGTSGTMGTSGGTMGTTGGAAGTDGASGSQGMGNSSPAKDGSANSPKCKAGDTACDTNGTTTPKK